MVTSPNGNPRTTTLDLLGIELKPWQQSTLELISNSADSIHQIVGRRQVGKTYFAVVYAILHALQTPNVTCKVIGPSRREQIDFIRTIREILHSTEFGETAVLGSDVCHVKFANGSAIETGVNLSHTSAAYQLREATTGLLSIITHVTDPDLAVATELARDAKLAGTEMLIDGSEHSFVKTATIVSAAEATSDLPSTPSGYKFLNQSRYYDTTLTESVVSSSDDDLTQSFLTNM